MKALSIRQPWAWLIIKGEKPVENRSWYSGYHGPLFIHAGLSFDAEGYLWVQKHFPKIIMPGPSGFTKGAIIGLVTMVGCIEEGHDYTSPWFTGPCGFLFGRPEEFTEPIPCKGKFGLFEVETTMERRNNMRGQDVS